MNKKWQDILDKSLKPKDIYKFWRLDETEYEVEKIEDGYLQKYRDNKASRYYDHYVSGAIEGFRTYKNMVSCETADIGFDCPYGDEPLYPLYFTPNWGMAKKYSKIVDWIIFDKKDLIIYGGTGESFNWNILDKIDININYIISGGLTYKNVLEALNTTSAKGVDVSSGVETTLGNKSEDLIKKFCKSVKLCRGEEYC